MNARVRSEVRGVDAPDERYDVETSAETRAAERHRRIEEAAYYRAEKRGFEPGHALADWIAAEAEIALHPPPLEDD
jgi:hypothetical protein